MLGTYIDRISSAITATSTLHTLKRHQQPPYAIAELDHCFIRYRMEGQGRQTLVFAADPPVHLEDYDTLVNHLKEDYTVVVFEIPGFGFSFSKLSMSYAFDACVAVIRQFLDHLNRPPYALAFPCAAGYFSLRLAAQCPDTISHLIMLQTPDWKEEQHWKHRLDPKRLMSTPVVGQLLMKAKKRDIAHQWIDYACGTPEVSQQIQAQGATNFDLGACYCLASALQVSLPAQEPPLGPLAQPAIALYGMADRSHKGTDFTSITKYFQPTENIEVIGLEGIGHLPEIEAPQEVSRYIRKLLG